MKLPTEPKYGFRKRMRVVHRENIRDFSLTKKNNEFEFANGVTLVLPKSSGAVLKCAGEDFAGYLFTSMSVSAMVGYVPAGETSVYLNIDSSIDEDYIIDVSENIVIRGKTERALAQALYALEDKMNLRKAPFVEKGIISHTFMFSPRMVHSGYALDDYPNEHLSSIAHAGMDAILIFVKDVNMTPSGFLDFNDLIDRAARYGLDVYAYSYMKSQFHPDDAGAKEFYENLYGRLFECCPGFKGVILVGESVGFPSHDTRVAPENKMSQKDGIPYLKPRPGYFPCSDYPLWLDLIKNTIRAHKKDADIVFWTYNWGYADAKERLELIEALPTDITLMVTYEMFESYKLGLIKQTVADYSLAFPGPGFYFISEAEVAKKRGIKLYAMTNTGGLTWDMGTIPYEPMPLQWMKRHQGLREANGKYGLCGLMESHHYGYWPSFIGELAKQNFIKENSDLNVNLRNVIKMHFGLENTDEIIKALKKWSDAIANYTPTDADQYGAFRCGPSYPLCLVKAVKPPTADFAHFGNRILFTTYPADYAPNTILPCGRGMLPSLRINGELKALYKMQKLMEEGLAILKEIDNPSEEFAYLVNLGEYICTCVQTGIHAKEWYMLTGKLKIETNRSKVLKMIEEVKGMLLSEKENALRALDAVKKDSRLGWEPSMDYIGGVEAIEWKLRHLEYVLDFEVGCFVNGSADKWYE